MSIEAFSSAVKSQIYKDWLKKLDKNIVTSTVDALRSSQQVASKTSFYISKKTVKEMYKTVTGINMEDYEAELFLKELAKPGGGSSGIAGTFVNIAGSTAVKFESIGFDTISSKLVALFDSYQDVQDAYHRAEDDYVRLQKQALDADPTLRGREKQKLIDDIEKEGKRQGSFGYYFNKGHVISLATNLAKQFRDELDKADAIADKQRNLLIGVLDSYIQKLQADDLASANLPDAINQEIYASYIKSSDKYLVEIQFSTTNIESGRQSIAAVTELRKLFRLTDKDATDILKSPSGILEKLIATPGSPSYVDLIAQDLVNILEGKPKSNKVYAVNQALIVQKTTKIQKPKSNAEEIAKLKAAKEKLKAVKKDLGKIVVDQPAVTYSLANLLDLLNINLQHVISANMGDGSRKDILNYRTGRFAASVKVDRLSQSREGMITAFYSYMKNPYQTFEPGYKQGAPKTRDPKLLIARSIREIAQTQVANRMRAVSA